MAVSCVIQSLLSSFFVSTCIAERTVSTKDLVCWCLHDHVLLPGWHVVSVKLLCLLLSSARVVRSLGYLYTCHATSQTPSCFYTPDLVIRALIKLPMSILQSPP